MTKVVYKKNQQKKEGIRRGGGRILAGGGAGFGDPINFKRRPEMALQIQLNWKATGTSLSTEKLFYKRVPGLDTK